MLDDASTLDTVDDHTHGAGIERPDERPHAVVIGSGFGGLAAAVRLGARGYRVSVFEQRDQPGGRAYVYRQDGFTFDGGPTVITAPFLLEELWALCGRRLADDVELRPVSPFYQIRFHDGEVFNYSGDTEAMCREIARFEPADVDGYRRYLEASEATFKVGFEELADVPFHSLRDMLRIVPDIVRLGGASTVYGMTSRYFKSERLRTVFSFHPLLVGGNPLTTTAIYGLIAYLEKHYGVFFAMGGTGSLIQGLVNLVRGQGGSVTCDAPVREITVDDGRASGVRLGDGTHVAADIVVSNGDAAWTYANLLPGRKRKRWTDGKIKRSRYSMSLFVWYFGTDRQYPDVEHHTILLGPRYRGLLTDIFGRKELADDFSLYLHRPTATDPTLAPEGCDAFYVLSPVPHQDSDVDWEEMGERYRQRIADFLESTTLPGLGDAVVSSHFITPRHFEDDLLSFRGAAFGLEPTLLQSAWFRAHNRSEELDGLYLVGASTHPGAGVPGVLSSAKVLDKVVPHAETLA
ncbi:MAG: phytoene desaturase [Pseudomonadota bacterium]